MALPTGVNAAPAEAEPGAVGAMIDAVHGAAATLGNQNIVTLGLIIALLSATALAMLMLLRSRRQAARTLADAHDEEAALRAEIDRLKALLLAEPQVLVAWAAGADEPDIVGDTSIAACPAAWPSACSPSAAGWSRQPRSAWSTRSKRCARDGRGFTMTLTTDAAGPIEAEGRAVAGRAVLRLRDVSGIERELIDLAARHDKLTSDVETHARRCSMRCRRRSGRAIETAG